MSELYGNLLFRYRYQWKVIDDNGLKGIILFNEPKPIMRRLWCKFKYSDKCYVKTETIMIKRGHGFGFKHKKPIHEICIIEFVKFGLTRGYDWKLYGQPEWEAIEPEKKIKFIKPKKRKRNVRTNSSKR